jgi:hypothetical protein
VVWRHSDFVLRQDEVAGVRVFMKDHQDVSEEKCQKVVTFLQLYPLAKVVYLEYLVKERGLQVH